MLAKKWDAVCRIDRSGRLQEFYGPKGMTRRIAIGETMQTYFVNPHEKKTFSRMSQLAIESNSPYTMIATIRHNGNADEFYIRLKKYGADIMLIMKKE